MKLNTQKKEYWITVKRGDDEMDFLVSPLSSKESFDLIDDATTSKWKRGVKDEKTDLYKLKMLRIKSVIKDWRKAEDADGNPLPFNQENLELAYNYNQDLINEALDRADEITAQAEEKVENDIKNSKAG